MDEHRFRAIVEAMERTPFKRITLTLALGNQPVPVKTAPRKKKPDEPDTKAGE